VLSLASPSFIVQELRDRVLFASSVPAQDPAEAARDFAAITFAKPGTHEAVLYQNAERLLKTGK